MATKIAGAMAAAKVLQVNALKAVSQEEFSGCISRLMQSIPSLSSKQAPQALFL